VEDGWDWNHPPGATTIERPFAELEPTTPLLMFKSEETYAGGCALNSNGVWAMELNEGKGYTIDPKKKKMTFPGRLQARKSVFCFGNQLLCLGSGIRSSDPSASVHTTLFQNGIKQLDDTLYENGEGLLLDPIGNGYKMLDGSEVVVSASEQTSPNNQYSLRAGKGKEGANPEATGLFATAWIDHGTAPKDDSYAYSIFPMTGCTNFQALEEYIAQLPVLGIRRGDNFAHIVEDPQSQTTAYACFEAGALGDPLLETVSAPCFAMIQQSAGMLKLSVANPDLNQHYNAKTGNYEGSSHETLLKLKLNGRWKVMGSAEAWTVADGDSTQLIVKCLDGKSTEVKLEQSTDQTLYEAALALKWTTPFFDGCFGDWTAQWQLDGEFATVKNSKRGMSLVAGNEEFNPAHNAVLWTKHSFKGDLRIDYDYTRLDRIDQWGNALYIQPPNKDGEFPQEVMNLLSINYADWGKEDRGSADDQIQCSRHQADENGSIIKTKIYPDSFRTGLFDTGKTYHITIIKRGDRLFFNVKDRGGKETLFSWQSPLIEEISGGRIGLHQMWKKSARYKNFSISVLGE
jgi:hypothetical protein